MANDPILTPSECVKLSEIEAKMTPGEWRSDERNFPTITSEDGDPEFSVAVRGGFSSDRRSNAIGIVALRNAAPRMLATIEDLRADVASLKAANDELQRDSDDRDERIDTQYRTIAAHEATIAELRGEAERRPADIQDIRVTVAELRKELEERT